MVIVRSMYKLIGNFHNQISQNILKFGLRRTILFIIIIIIIIISLDGLGLLNCSGNDALPSFPRASTISSSSRFVVEGVFRESGVVHSFKMVDQVLFVFGSHFTGYAGGNFMFPVGPPKPDKP